MKISRNYESQKKTYQHNPNQKEGVASEKKKDRYIVNKEVNLIVFKERTVDDLVVQDHLFVLF